MKRALREPRDDDDRQVLRDVVESGCHVVGVLADQQGPAFAYSIGLFHNYDHPEILLFGLDHTIMQQLINRMRDEIQEGARYVSHSRYDSIIQGFSCEFLTVHSTRYRDLFGYAIWFYAGTDFPALQCVWPDRNGKFPWQPDFDPKFKLLQPTQEEGRSEQF